MASSSLLVRRSLRIEETINEHCSSGPGLHMQRTPLRRELLRLLVLGDENPQHLSELLSLKPINLKLRDRMWRLSCAVYLWKRYRVSIARAAKLTNVPEADLIYVASLAESTQESLLELSMRLPPRVRAEVDAFLERLTVSLDQRAIEDLLLAAAETYAVKAGGKGRKYTEIYGLCFGTRKAMPPNGSPEFDNILNVTRIVTQMRARARASEVTPNDKSAKIHRQVAERFFRHLELVGDYHTHPFPDLQTMRDKKGWMYSPSDQTSIQPWLEDVRKEGADPRFSLVLAIARGGKNSNRRARRLAPNRIQFALDEYFFILSAYRIRRDGMYDSKITLECPHVKDV